MPYARARVYQDEPRRWLQRHVDEYFAEHPLRRVLDAGAGYELPLDVPLDARLTALDASEEALSKNQNADDKIVADLQTCRLPPDSYDEIICWWVLEHLECPLEGLRNMATALRSDGLLIIAVPYLWGMKAVATKLTPYRFHVWIARKSDPEAGTPGVAPYRTYLRRDIAPGRMRRVAAGLGLELLYSRADRGNPEAHLPWGLQVLWRAVGRGVQLLTLGRIDPLLSDYVVVFRKA